MKGQQVNNEQIIKISLNREEQAYIIEASWKRALSINAFMRQALRIMQLIDSGNWELKEINPLRKMNDDKTISD